jgi:arsenate reductase
MDKRKVLFVCVHNSARSQMAEELLRNLAGDQFEVESAGIEPGILNPIVVDVLKKEEGINIEGKKTRAIFDVFKSGKHFDCLITVCDKERAERCPVLPRAPVKINWSFADPTQFQGSYEEKYRRTSQVKEEIKEQIVQWLGSLDKK